MKKVFIGEGRLDTGMIQLKGRYSNVKNSRTVSPMVPCCPRVSVNSVKWEVNQ